MTQAAAARPPLVRLRSGTQFFADLVVGFENLKTRKMRTLLTMLGMIFGVAAVVSMLSIGAGAQKEVITYIKQLGVHNLIIEANEAADEQTLQKIRRISPGLTFQDLRVIRTNVSVVVESTARKRVTPSKMIPKPSQDMPVVYGVSPAYQQIANLHIVAGRFFEANENDRAAPVCVLGQRAKANLFGPQDALGQYVKVGDQWFQVVGVTGAQLTAQTNVPGLPAQDMNNLIYVPLDAAIYRLADVNSRQKDEIDGVYLKLAEGADSAAVSDVVRGILNASHHNAGDFSIILPAELLAEQRRTERIFDIVMVAIASISLLVGGIGIMNIMLANILERTHEIGVRRAVGARQADIIRQFLVEAILISFVGGLVGIAFGFGMSRLIAWLAGWSTIVTANSILLAFLVSASVGLAFGIYPATKAARLDPVEALRAV